GPRACGCACTRKGERRPARAPAPPPQLAAAGAGAGAGANASRLRNSSRTRSRLSSICRVTDTTVRYQIQRSPKPGTRASRNAGMTTTVTRTTEETSEGTVLPIAWNVLEHTKTMPDATKFQDTIRRYSVPTAITSGSFEKIRIIAAGARWQATAKNAITPAAMKTAVLNVSRTRSGWRAPKFWPATGATANPSATTGKKPRRQNAHPDPEARLRGGPERAAHDVDREQVDRHHRELRPGGKPDPENLAPQADLRLPVGGHELERCDLRTEVEQHPGRSHHDRDERGQPSARDA